MPVLFRVEIVGESDMRIVASRMLSAARRLHRGVISEFQGRPLAAYYSDTIATIIARWEQQPSAPAAASASGPRAGDASVGEPA